MRCLLPILLIVALASASGASFAQDGVATSVALPAETLGAPQVAYASGQGNPAPTASFYFGDATGTPISTYATAGPGSAVSLSVWYQTAAPHNSVDILVGYDRSVTATESATRLDNEVALSGDADSAVTPIDPNFNDLGNAESGGAGDSGPARPYGDDVELLTSDPNFGTVTAPNPTHLFDISLVTTANYTGAYDVTLYSAPSGASDTTFVFDGTTYVRPPTYTLHLADAPEPSGAWVWTLGIAALGLRGCALKRVGKGRVKPRPE